MGAFERRALVMLVVVALLLLRAVGVFPPQTWVTGRVHVRACLLAAASVLLVAVIAPAAYIGRWDLERGRLLFLAFSLLVADVLVTALIFAYQAYETNNHFIGG